MCGREEGGREADMGWWEEGGWGAATVVPGSPPSGSGQCLAKCTGNERSKKNFFKTEKEICAEICKTKEKVIISGMLGDCSSWTLKTCRDLSGTVSGSNLLKSNHPTIPNFRTGWHSMRSYGNL